LTGHTEILSPPDPTLPEGWQSRHKTDYSTGRMESLPDETYVFDERCEKCREERGK